jgi:formate/nitrite transporter FocA (FNT family)
MLKKIVSGVIAGILIALGGGVFLACENRYVGAALFSVALLCICMKQYALYTGKICYIPEKHGKEQFSVLLLGLLGNLIGTYVCGQLVRVGLPALEETAFTICSAKLEQTFLQTLIRGFFCGILMYAAVWIYREKKTALGILFCIPVFILSGFEHSIADMFYFALAGLFNPRAFVFILLVVLGNSLGGLFIPAIQSLKGGPRS